MAVDPLILVRKRIGDNKKTETESFALAPDTVNVELRYSNASIFSLHDRDQSTTILVANTDYEFNAEAGVVTLLYTPKDQAVLSAVYYYYAFTDAELQELIDGYGVNGACVEALRWLIADSARLHDYSRGATSESLSQIIKNLQSVLKDYEQNLGNDPAGGTSPDMVVAKRTNQFYRGTRPHSIDLSRDDSLSQ